MKSTLAVTTDRGVFAARLTYSTTIYLSLFCYRRWWKSWPTTPRKLLAPNIDTSGHTVGRAQTPAYQSSIDRSLGRKTESCNFSALVMAQGAAPLFLNTPAMTPCFNVGRAVRYLSTGSCISNPLWWCQLTYGCCYPCRRPPWTASSYWHLPPATASWYRPLWEPGIVVCGESIVVCGESLSLFHLVSPFTRLVRDGSVAWFWCLFWGFCFCLLCFVLLPCCFWSLTFPFDLVV